MRINNFISLVLMLALMLSCNHSEVIPDQRAPISTSIKLPEIADKLSQSSILNSKKIPSLVGGNPDIPFDYTARAKHHTSKLAHDNYKLVSRTPLPNLPTKKEVPADKTTKVTENADNNNQIRILFQNDIFTNTDYYFTNGVNIEFVTPMAKRAFYKLLPAVAKKADIELNGFSVTQNIYTPTNPDVENILDGDRPFSAILTLGQFKESYSISNKLFIKSRLEFGVLGPASLGKTVQSSIHQIEPVGWNNQIANWPVVNFYFYISKSLISSNHFEFALTGDVAAGTAYNRASPGVSMRTGNFVPLLRGPAALGRIAQWQYWFFLDASSSLVVYDATLQGSFFSQNDPYVIEQDNISRVVAEIAAGLAVYKRNIGFEFTLHYLSPEFKNARHFQWGSVAFNLKL